MQHKINKENLAIALKHSKLEFLEFLNKFVRYHVTKEGNVVNVQESNNYSWIKKIYNNIQCYYEENTIKTLSKVLKVTPEFLIDKDQQDLIQEFNLGYECYLRTRVINYLKTQNSIENAIKFSSELNKDLINCLESIKNASNKFK